jgi:DNA phosphorothioation-dependent restriction protein DptG
MLDYQFSQSRFCKTFSIPENKEDEKFQLRHNSGIAIKIFPFNTKRDMPQFTDIIGRYINDFSQKILKKADYDNVIKKKILKNKYIREENKSIFATIIKKLYFEQSEEGILSLKPNNLDFMATIECEKRYRRVADYLYSVLGINERISDAIKEARDNCRSSSNVLEQFLIKQLEKKNSSDIHIQPYYKVVTCFDNCFDEDFEYIIKSEEMTKEYLIELLGLYYVMYTIQTAQQLNKFLEGKRDQLVPVYFCLESEKTSRNRDCYTHGWHAIQKSLSKMFVHVNTLEILNQIKTDSPLDYIYLQNLIDTGSVSEEKVVEQIKLMKNFYMLHITEPMYSNEIKNDNMNCNANKAVRDLFDCVDQQFVQTVRNKPMEDFSSSFIDTCGKKYLNYIQPRGRNGAMLSISDDRLIFLTRLCIKNKEKMKLNDVFCEFERRGVFFDKTSKLQIMEFYDRLNLIEKKSDSGDAQYVKRIL